MTNSTDPADAAEQAWQEYTASYGFWDSDAYGAAHRAFIEGYRVATHAADANAAAVLRDPAALHLHLLRNPLQRDTLLHLLGDAYLAEHDCGGGEPTLSVARQSA